MTTLQQLIEDNKLTYVNPDITDDNFPLVDFSETDFKLFNFSCFISSENAISEMEKEGYRPANIFELLTWNKTNKEDGLFVALGSCINLHDRRVPYLGLDGSERELGLSWWGSGWLGGYRFLAVRKSSPLTSEPLALEPALDVLAPRSEITWENLRAGDLTKNKNNATQKVLTRFNDLVALSKFTNHSAFGAWITISTAATDYTIVQPNKTPRKVTLAEIAEKFGEEVEVVE